MLDDARPPRDVPGMSPNGPPSDGDRLDAIRRHADHELRYYATALLQENEDQVRTCLTSAANYMALVEGEALDARSMMERRSTIAERYLEAAERDPWTPPCSFCGESPTVAWFEGPRFEISVDAASEVHADEAWTACAPCFDLVRTDDREELARRGTRRFEDGAGPEQALAMARGLHDTFWTARSTGRGLDPRSR